MKTTGKKLLALLLSALMLAAVLCGCGGQNSSSSPASDSSAAGPVDGTYTGTGAAGSATPNTLTFSHKPVLVTLRQRYYDNGEAGEVYAEVPVGDMALSEDGLFYTAQITVSADAWSQVFAATICDADGTALSNTNYYSVSLYASRYITDDMEDSLSRVLRAMLQAIAA